MTMYEALKQRSVPGLIRLACVLAITALTLMAYSVLVPRPLPVIVAMSAGHAIGATAFACYLLSVVLDAAGLGPKASAQKPSSAVLPTQKR